MIKISQELQNLVQDRESEIRIGVEIYPRDVEDISSISAPANAIARFSNGCFTWSNSSGDYEYQAKIAEFESVKKFLTEQQNEVSLQLSNVERGKNSGANFVLNNKIKGCWLVIRLIFPELPDEAWLIWWGKCLRPGKINGETVNIQATQEIGNYNIKFPFRTFGVKCPLTPGKGDCLGNQTVEQKSALYQEQYALYGTMLCPDRTRQTCINLGNELMFQGQPAVALSGTFSYIDTKDNSTEQQKNKKKKLPAVKTESWSAVNQSETTSNVVPLGFGRFQLAGHPITWADTGSEIRSILGFCEGRIGGFDFIKCRNSNLTLGTVIEHYGDYGGSGSQSPDVLFGGFTGYNSRLAYLEVVVTGSEPDEVDSSPLITAVIRGMQIPVPDSDGNYTTLDSSSNPIHIIRFLFTDDKYGKVPAYRMADDVNLESAAYCDGIIEDRTQSEWIILPTNEEADYGQSHRRYGSESRVSSLNLMWEQDNQNFPEPWFNQPLVEWYQPFSQPPLLDKRNILRKRYAINGAIQEETSLLEFIQKRALPCFRGWINYNKDGKIEIRTRRPIDNSRIRADIKKDTNIIPISNVDRWTTDLSGYLLIGAGLETSEIRKVSAVYFSPACNDFPIEVTTNGTITSTISPIQGGSLSSQGLGYIDLQGEVSPNCEIRVKFNQQPFDFWISYVTDGQEDLGVVAIMLKEHFNANLDFKNYLKAFINPTKPNRVYIQCQAGFLEVNIPLEFEHATGEEIMRVQAVYENCNALDADLSSNFDNIAINSFSWSEDSSDDEINAFSSNYTSAVDDFHIAKTIPRTSWDTIDLEGELIEETLDLRLIDNYWQAAYITKCTAIERIDGNIPFSWRTGISGYMLELDDVVAVRHDSGDGAIRYTPVWIESIVYSLNDLTADIQGRLYLSGAYDERVQQVDQFLTTTLNPQFVPFTPPAVGTHGGYSQSSQPQAISYAQYDYFRDSRYSPNGLDLV